MAGALKVLLQLLKLPLSFWVRHSSLAPVSVLVGEVISLKREMPSALLPVIPVSVVNAALGVRGLLLSSVKLRLCGVLVLPALSI